MIKCRLWVLDFLSFPSCRNRIGDLGTNSLSRWPTKLVLHRLGQQRVHVPCLTMWQGHLVSLTSEVIRNSLTSEVIQNSLAALLENSICSMCVYQWGVFSSSDKSVRAIQHPRTRISFEQDRDHSLDSMPCATSVSAYGTDACEHCIDIFSKKTGETETGNKRKTQKGKKKIWERKSEEQK